MYKTCNECQQQLPRESFYKLQGKAYKDNWDCRSSCCKQCTSKTLIERTRKNKEAAVKYKGGKCEDCGLVTDIYGVYDFHHLDPSKKEYAFGTKMKKLESIKQELDKCVLLCSNCHRIRHYKQ